MLIEGSPVRTQERATEPKKDLDPPSSVVSDYFASASGRHFPQMLLATTVVAVLPLVVSLGLRASGLVSGSVSVGLAVVMSLASSTAGSAYWRKRGRNTEVLFGELLLWGWIRSWRQERELANATRLLALVNTGTTPHDPPDELSVEQHEHLLQQLAGALEGQDVYLNGHSRRVARHATMIARGMGLASEEVARIRAAAAVHDVGKLRTPKAVLNKPGRLTDDEFEVIKRHPVHGAEMVAALGDPELTRIVRHHHERLDGAGYPDRLRGEEIPLGARIIAVADTFDAITSVRPYREAAPHQKAIDILRLEAGSQLDPDAVRSFLAYYSGSRSTALWAILTSSLRRVVSWLSGDPAAAATISASKVAAATAATAAIGATAGVAPVPVVHHPPARPVVSHAHNVPARPRGGTATLGRHGVAVALPAISANGSTTTKASPAKPHGKNQNAATRSHAQPNARRQANGHAAQAATGSRAQPGAASPSGSGTANRPSQSTPSSAGATRQSTATFSAPAAAPSSSQSSSTAPADNKSQGSNANGNGYGHTKVLGNGNGKGEAKGHGDPTPVPAVPSSSGTISTPAATVTTSTSSSSSNDGQGNDNGNGNGNGNSQGNGNGHGNAQAVVSVVTPPVSVTVTAGSQGAQGTDGNNNGSNDGNDGNGNGNGNGNGGDHGNGHGHGG